MARLTESVIAALACEGGKKDRLVFDDVVPGLAVRVMASGAKAFLAQYTFAGKKRRVPIGRWGAVSLQQARSSARGILGDVAKGRDVAHLRAAERTRASEEAAAEKMTLAALLQQWSDIGLAQRRESYRREAVRAMKTAFPQHLARRADSLSRDDAVRRLDALAKVGKGVMAGRTLAYGRACYGWAAKRGMVAVNPFVGLPIAKGTSSRDRVLTDQEVQLVWQAAGELGWPFGPLMRLLLLTGQRRDEVAAMAWSELSADMRIWTIPKERAKNGRAHIVHLAPAAQAVMLEVPRFGDAALVFTTTGKNPVSGFSRAKERLDNLIHDARKADNQPSPLAAWRIHDFRRTLVTWLAGNGVAPHIADRLLNHVEGTISGVAAVYQRGEFLMERKAALEAWAEHVVASSNEGR